MEKMIKAYIKLKKKIWLSKWSNLRNLNKPSSAGQGQLRLDLFKHRIESENNIEIIFEEPKFLSRTDNKVAKAEYRHKNKVVALDNLVKFI